MPKIKGSPPGTLRSAQVQTALGRNRQGLLNSGINEFLRYYEVGRARLYDQEDVAMLSYWLLVRDVLIGAFGHLSPKAPLLPPGDTNQDKRIFLEAWFEEDPHGVACPACEGEAVQVDGAGPIWCSKCGLDQNEGEA